MPDEEADWDSIDYIYRVVLAQEKKDCQQVGPEGGGYGATAREAGLPPSPLLEKNNTGQLADAGWPVL